MDQGSDDRRRRQRRRRSAAAFGDGDRRSKAGEDPSVAVVVHVDGIAWTVCSSLAKTGEATRPARDGSSVIAVDAAQ
ncbi:hypothetical protein [Actinoplanes sp. NPDC049802]|uniref:hypothetical protein n=1 Tax=Actinoplanes sp. NPDC049802 TaxID=3154742 RepID=UPI0033E1328B